MLFTVNEFCKEVERDLYGLIDELCISTSRDNSNERAAMEKSFRQLSPVLAAAQTKNRQLGDAHLVLGDLMLEYRLPSASAWCDAVLVGKDKEEKPQVLIIELKHWETKDDAPGLREGLILHKGMQYQHPSDQVKGYAMYCRRFHSAVHENNAIVNGCAFHTNTTSIEAYKQAPNDKLTADFPVFNATETERDKFSNYLADKIHSEDKAFAEKFHKGIYSQDKNILVQVAKNLKDSKARPFELLDEQRRGFNLVMNQLEISAENKNQDDFKKQVIIVEGPPGSGKSALAANLWIEAVLKFIEPDLKIKKAKKDIKAKNLTSDNIVFVTTSSSQKSNWQKTFEQLGLEYSGKGFILPSNQFNPGLSGAKVKAYREEGHPMLVKNWQDNIAIFHKDPETKNYSPDNLHFISVVDEAHALINTEGHEIGFASGWCLNAGPQAFHIIRSSKVSIFLLDQKQSYRDSETTTVANIEDFASRLNADVHKITLEGHQFRCGGSKEYVDWIEKLFSLEENRLHDTWRRTDKNPKAPFIFDFVDYPHQLDDQLLDLHGKGQTVRLVSSYSRQWITKKENHPHTLDPEKMDFYFKYQNGATGPTVWAKPWNYAPGEDYSFFIQAPDGTEMHENPVCEVGCPYVVRGFDYDYLGLLWLDDLVWRKDKWVIKVENVHETAIKSTAKNARKKVPTRDTKKATVAETLLLIEESKQEVIKKVIKGYRILMTRAIKGMYIYVQDEETKNYLQLILK